MSPRIDARTDRGDLMPWNIELNGDREPWYIACCLWFETTPAIAQVQSGYMFNRRV